MYFVHSIKEMHRPHPYRSLNVSTSASIPLTKDGLNGVGSPRSHEKAISRITLYGTAKFNGTSSEVSSSRSLHHSKSKRSTSLTNGTRSVSTAKTANDPPGSKSSTSPLKIRIPGRLLQNRSSNGTAAASASTQAPAPVSSVQAPRRSLRRNASTSQTGSERSLSVDQDGRF